MSCNAWHNKSLVRTQTTLRFVCAAQLQRYVHMKIFFTILLTLYANQSIGSAVPRFVITSNCISSIEVKESGYIPGWTLIAYSADREH